MAFFRNNQRYHSRQDLSEVSIIVISNLFRDLGFDPSEVRIRGLGEVRDHDLGRATKDRSLQRSASPSKRTAALRERYGCLGFGEKKRFALECNKGLIPFTLESSR